MKKLDELFEGDFSDSEKAAAARRAMEIQDRVRHSGRTEIVLSVLFCAVYFILAAVMFINFDEVIESNIDPQRSSLHSRHLSGEAGVAEDVIFIIFVPGFSIGVILGAAASAEKENKRYREFTARKFTVAKVSEHESVKGLYTVTVNCSGRQICFDTSDKAAKDYDKGSVMIVVEFLGVNENAPEKNYDYYAASDEQRRTMAFRKAQKYKYVIIHT